ncbi:hypothetical protein NLI96_g6105 [Meripilus lineatus]|uniref:Serine protease n=1 Tax=Meripilus lineatus TaxID=2056292 RepID=A0AAD5V414_9APHY|nr:hypothetical protein NLI96_g6105 [Physisporinus lineatus]
MEEERRAELSSDTYEVTRRNREPLSPEWRERELNPNTAEAKSDGLIDLMAGAAEGKGGGGGGGDGGDSFGDPSTRAVPVTIHEAPSPTPHGSPLVQQPHYPNSTEAMLYYHGLPSKPPLLVRSSINTPWGEPSEGSPRIKQFFRFTEHQLHNVWEDDLAFKIHGILELDGIEWTSTDLVDLGWKDESSSHLTVWIGVDPEHFYEMNDDHKKDYVLKLGGVVLKCLRLLHEYGIDDVEVEIRLSTFVLCTQLRTPSPSDLVSDHHFFSTAIGHMIGPPTTSGLTSFGTGGFFMTVDGDDDTLLLVTARHVVFPDSNTDSDYFDNIDDISPRHDVLLIGDDQAFEESLGALKQKIADAQAIALGITEELVDITEEVIQIDQAAPEEKEAQLLDANRKLIALRRLENEMTKKWGSESKRIIGHVILAVPENSHRIDLNYQGEDDDDTPADFPDDWAVVAIDPGRIRASHFQGNILDLGTDEIDRWMPIIQVDGQDSQSSSPNGKNRLLPVKGRIPPELYDKPIQVLKRGARSGLTVGRSAGFAYHRDKYKHKGKIVWSVKSKVWAITPYLPSSAFSQQGDSGSTVVDCSGRIGGIMYGGVAAKKDAHPDITYAIPVDFLCERMEHFGISGVKF